MDKPGQRAAFHLAVGGARQGIDKTHFARALIGCQTRSGIIPDAVGGRCCTGFRHDERADDAHVVPNGDLAASHFGDVGMRGKNRLHLERRNTVAKRIHEIVIAAEMRHISVVVHDANVATYEPIAASDGAFDNVRSHLETRAPLNARRITPIIAVPSTAGTGSEVTSWATVWDSANEQKYSLANPALYPEAAIVDPALTLGAPRALTLTTGLDALSHALESLWNVSANPVSANFAVEAARDVIAVLPRLVEDLGNLDLRVRQARAALFAGFAFSNTRTALAHNISYDITLKQGTPHGIACSFCLADVMQWSIGCDPVCDDNLRKIFGEDLRTGVQTLRRFIESLGVSTEPSAYGLNDNEWRMLVERAMAGERGRNFIGRADLAA